MTNERRANEPGVEHDALVSDTYRDAARESAPAHLDKKVLDAAARAARPRYSLFRAWTRPAAWAATIMLSAALILELTQPTVQQPATMDAIAPGGAAEPDLAKRERMVREPKVKDDDMLQRAEEMARFEDSLNQQPDQAAPESEERVAAPAAAFAVSSKAALDSSNGLANDLSPCDAEATAEPESWLVCIIELEAAGLTDIADEQRALLAEAFPDFDSR